LHVRKNMITGYRVLDTIEQLRHNSSLKVLDLQINQIETACEKLLISILRENLHLEEVQLEGNTGISIESKAQIVEECK